uniref:Uncharacterized protein n=1 Tax=Glossina pallidipes TaxID=7398 RepID=A0A1A9ZRW4_GLOPL
MIMLRYRVFCKLLQTWLRLNHHFVSVVSSHFASVAIGLASFCDLDSSAALPGFSFSTSFTTLEGSERPSTKIGMVRIKVPPGVCGGGGDASGIPVPASMIPVLPSRVYYYSLIIAYLGSSHGVYTILTQINSFLGNVTNARTSMNANISALEPVVIRKIFKKRHDTHT